MKILPPLLAILSATPALPDGQGAEVLDLSDGDRVVMSYQANRLPSPDPAAPWYGRSGFIHPIRTPGGRIVSDAFPADHLHQHGVMMAWTSSRIGDRKVDFWNSKKQEGRVEHVETVSADAGRIVVKLRHIDATTEPPTSVLEETWEITRVPHPAMNVFDLVSRSSRQSRSSAAIVSSPSTARATRPGSTSCVRTSPAAGEAGCSGGIHGVGCNFRRSCPGSADAADAPPLAGASENRRLSGMLLA